MSRHFCGVRTGLYERGGSSSGLEELRNPSKVELMKAMRRDDFFSGRMRGGDKKGNDLSSAEKKLVEGRFTGRVTSMRATVP